MGTPTPHLSPPPPPPPPPPPLHGLLHTKMAAIASASVLGLPALAPRAVSKRSAVQKIAAAPVRTVAARKSVLVKASAERKAVAAASTAASAFAATPSFALVDQRLNGDGVGLPLGVSDPVLFWVIAFVFTGIWALYYTSSLQEFGDDSGDGDDSGLTL